MSASRGSTPPLLVAMTGATGAIYGIRLLERLRALGVETHLVVSRWAETTIRTETSTSPDAVRALAAYVHEEDDLAAPPASDSFVTAAMIVCPCSMRTVAALAHGLSDNLVQRAAELHLHQGRRLVLVVRESPLSAIHLENLTSVSRAGAIVAPPVPAFYARLRSLEDMVDHTVGRVLDHAGIEHDGIRRWGESRRSTLRRVEP